jgi:hypothetical protein
MFWQVVRGENCKEQHIVRLSETYQTHRPHLSLAGRGRIPLVYIFSAGW